MQFLGMLLVFGGYTLIYAATANHGKFATEPWAGVLTDAYSETPNASSPQAPAGPTPVRSRNRNTSPHVRGFTG